MVADDPIHAGKGRLIANPAGNGVMWLLAFSSVLLANGWRPLALFLSLTLDLLKIDHQAQGTTSLEAWFPVLSASTSRFLAS